MTELVLTIKIIIPLPDLPTLWQNYIDRLSEYMASTGKQYQNHATTIRRWAAADLSLAEDEYIDPADGLIHCKKCHGSRQTVVPRFGGSGYFMPRCLCPCQQKEQKERKAMEEQRERMEHIKRRKAQGLQD